MRGTVFLFLFFWPLALFAQGNSGELRLNIIGPGRLAVQANVEITSAENEVYSSLVTNSAGYLAVPRLPFGIYSLRIHSNGLATLVASVEIRSPIPQEFTVVLEIEPAHTTINVTDSGTLVDPHRAGVVQRIGSSTIDDRVTAQPGRSVQDLVNEAPGWLYEGNAVLHPRGSEYQTQLVVDGIPLTDNRSPGIGPEIGNEDVESMSVYTAGYPAEYGRKLGGVVEINTVRDIQPGLHGDVELSGGSFDTRGGDAQLQYGWAANVLTLSGGGGASDWYLNPPVLENFTNTGSIGNLAVRFERDLDANNRLSLSLRHEQSRFEVPNELVQEAANQRQDRGNDETLGALSFQHVFSANLLADLRVMARSLDADLSSNNASTPIIATQNRSYDEQYVKAGVSYHRGANDWKAGVEADFATIDEQFLYQITNPAQFDPGTPGSFQFASSAPDREQAAFVQDSIRLGDWTASFGLRWDHYQLLFDQNALSPRIGIGRYIQPLGMVLHASYDRVFQTPAMENLLLSSSPQVVALNPQVLRLPVKPSLANFFEVGASKELASTMRMDVNYFRRTADNFADDDLLLNTSISFPIAFRRASIYGAEARLDLPSWKRLSGWVSYSYMVGTAYLPVTGGLFLGTDATNGLSQLAGRFPVSQDQRNTVRTRFRYEFNSRVWAAFGAEYGSGLPVEFDGTPAEAQGEYGSAIVDRVNFARGRVLPNLSLDASVSAELWNREKKVVRVQADVENLNNRLNLINFAGLFSGNTLAPPRSYHLRLAMSF